MTTNKKAAREEMVSALVAEGVRKWGENERVGVVAQVSKMSPSVLRAQYEILVGTWVHTESNVRVASGAADVGVS